MSSATFDLACDLIRRPSVTPEDAGCLELIGERLSALGFDVEILPYGEVTNLWARRGSEAPLFVFAGHTDVVPPGDLDSWHSDPFTPEVRENMLYGRGAADMKGGVAAMVTATERFLAATTKPRGSIGFLLTSDEEGPAIDGTVRVLDHLERKKEKIDWCLLGEPSSSATLGDTLRVGRRGSLNGRLFVNGIQGHVAYPAQAENPILNALPALTELAAVEWDQGNEFYPPTSFQISNIEAGTGAENVIPPRLEVWFNFRFSTESTAEGLQQKVIGTLDRHGLDYTLEWHLSGQPFLTEGGELIDAVCAAIQEDLHVRPKLDTGGGTSDGRFIAPRGVQVVEYGPVNATIHKINECIQLDDLDRLSASYERVLVNLLG